MNPRSVDVAIIGGGFSAIITAVNVCRYFESYHGNAKFEIAIVSDRDFGRGPAYKTTCPDHLLNVPTNCMSAFVDLPLDFFEWLQRNKQEGVNPDSFAKRHDYGNYLQHLFQHWCKKSKSNLSVSEIEDRAVSITRARTTFEIGLQSGSSVAATLVVLATGNARPSFGSMSDSAWFHNDPWETDIAAEVAGKDDVLLIGTGLTAIDVALSLRGAGHSGSVYALSRHGLLPRSHPALAAAKTGTDRSYLPPELPSKCLPLFKLIRCAMRSADMEQPDGWCLVMNQLRHRAQAVWQSLPINDKRMFLRHLRQLWEVHRHRTAPEVGAALTAMRNSGFLKIVAGRITSMQEDADGYVSIRCNERFGADKCLTVRHIVNCTGPNTNIRASKNAVLTSLLDSGIAAADELGLGLHCTADGAAISRDGIAQNNLYVLGTLRRGELWESTAVPELRVQAENCAAQIAQKLAGQPLSIHRQTLHPLGSQTC